MTLYSITKNNSFIKADTNGKQTTRLFENAEKFTTVQSASEMAKLYERMNKCKYEIVQVAYR